MSKASRQRALDILVHRCGKWSRVHLRDGRVCMTYDIAWGYDLGAEVAHMTTNVSPGPSAEDEVKFTYGTDFFRADEILTIEDEETGSLLFDRVES